MWWSIVLLLIVGLALIVVVALIFGAIRWRASTKEMHKNLEMARLPIISRTYNAAELANLPAPVQRYFRTVLEDGQPVVAAARVEHTGTFNLSETGDQWKPFTSTQRVITHRPGFDWEARIQVAPGLAVKVHDAYIAGEGILHASLFGLVPLAKFQGTPEAAQGELMRFLAEAAWYPTKLLPGQGVHWEAADDHSAKATLGDGDTELSLLFRFDENNLIESVRAESRWRNVKGTMVPTPWEGHFSQYELRHGMRIPLQGEVSWMLPQGPKLYWRGRITKLDYEFTE